MSIVNVSGVSYPIYAVQFTGTAGMALDQDITTEDEDGAAIDLTSATFNFVLGSITEATSGVTIIGGGSAGTISLSITDAAMAVITTGVYNIELSYTISGKTYRVYAGTYTARRSNL